MWKLGLTKLRQLGLLNILILTLHKAQGINYGQNRDSAHVKKTILS